MGCRDFSDGVVVSGPRPDRTCIVMTQGPLTHTAPPHRRGLVGLGGWAGLRQCLTWSPTHGPRCLPCGTRLGGCTQVSGHKACQTVGCHWTLQWCSRVGDAAVPVCMCPCASEGGDVAHLLAPLLVGVSACGTGECVPGAPGPGREAGEPGAEPAWGDAGLGSQPPRHKDKLPNCSTDCLPAREGGGRRHDRGQTDTS